MKGADNELEEIFRASNENLYSQLTYFRQVADLHYQIYDSQNLDNDNISETSRHIIFSEMVRILKDSLEPNTSSSISTLPKSVRKILKKFDDNTDFERSQKLAKKYWKIIYQEIDKLYPLCENFFKIAEDKFKAIDDLVKISKLHFPAPSLDSEHSLTPTDFLYRCQREARFHIIEIHKIKYQVEIQAAKIKEQNIGIVQGEIVVELKKLKLELENLKNNQEAGDSEDKSNEAFKSRTSLTKKPRNIFAKKPSNKEEEIAKKIKLLESKEIRCKKEIDKLWEEKRKATENYLQSYCKYRRRWIQDDGALTNLPLFNCNELNFYRFPSEGKQFAEEAYEAGLNLEGVNFGNIPITLEELATINSERLITVIGITENQAILLDQITGNYVFGIGRTKEVIEQENTTTEERMDNIGKVIDSSNSDLLSKASLEIQETVYNLSIFSYNSYLLWSKYQEKEKNFDEKKKENKNGLRPRRALSNWFKFHNKKGIKLEDSEDEDLESISKSVTKKVDDDLETKSSKIPEFPDSDVIIHMNTSEELAAKCLEFQNLPTSESLSSDSFLSKTLCEYESTSQEDGSLSVGHLVRTELVRTESEIIKEVDFPDQAPITSSPRSSLTKPKNYRQFSYSSLESLNQKPQNQNNDHSIG